MESADGGGQGDMDEGVSNVLDDFIEDGDTCIVFGVKGQIVSDAFTVKSCHMIQRLPISKPTDDDTFAGMWCEFSSSRLDFVFDGSADITKCVPAHVRDPLVRAFDVNGDRNIVMQYVRHVANCSDDTCSTRVAQTFRPIGYNKNDRGEIVDVDITHAAFLVARYPRFEELLVRFADIIRATKYSLIFPCVEAK